MKKYLALALLLSVTSLSLARSAILEEAVVTKDGLLRNLRARKMEGPYRKLVTLKVEGIKPIKVTRDNDGKIVVPHDFVVKAKAGERIELYSGKDKLGAILFKKGIWREDDKV